MYFVNWTIVISFGFGFAETKCTCDSGQWGWQGNPEIDKAKKSNSSTKNEIKNNYKRYEGAMNAGSKKYKKIQLGYYKNGTEKMKIRKI